MLPIRLGTPEEFAAVRGFLQQSGFTFDAICNRLGITAPYEFTRLRPGTVTTQPADVLDWLIRLFVVGEAVPVAPLAAVVPADVLQAMASLGLLAPCDDRSDQVYAPVALCAFDGLLFVSDRWSSPGETPLQLAADAVYPALTYNTQIFVNNLSYRPCESFLDLCAGTGVAAMLAASYARQVWAADVTERCAHFAEFNRQLNGLTNVTVVRGDLYEAVPGETFDHIVAHPPYVPVLEPKFVYHDGGCDGEEITRRIIAGLPTYLRPGGAFQCHTMATDRDRPLEQRIREWLGDAADEFDLLLVVRRQLAPASFAAEVALKNGVAQEFETWKKLFASWRVEKMLDICITLERHAEQRDALTMRRSVGAEAGAAEANWLLTWERMAAHGRVGEALLQTRPIMSPHLHLAIIHRIEQGKLQVVDCKGAVQYPYNVEAELDNWMPALLASCNGRVTGMELFEHMRQNGNIPADAPPEKFGALLAALIARGLIYVEEFAPPALRTMAASARS
jgi:SAM-dependent methyltransferase